MTTSYDELMAAKELLDRGLITQEEFDAKKAQLLADDAPADASSAPGVTTATAFAPKKRQKKTGLIVGIAAAAVAVVVVAAFAVTTIMPGDQGGAAEDRSGYSSTADKADSKASSSSSNSSSSSKGSSSSSSNSSSSSSKGSSSSSSSSQKDIAIGTWKGYFYVTDGENPKSLSSSTRVVVNADHTLTFGGGGVDMQKGTWKAIDENLSDGASAYEVSFDDIDTALMLIQKEDSETILTLVFDTDFRVFFKR